ncbi:MAG: hypothetical protein WCJ71_07365, partial [Candidatus Omnitrophota bacterium]
GAALITIREKKIKIRAVPTAILIKKIKVVMAGILLFFAQRATHNEIVARRTLRFVRLLPGFATE